MYVIQVDKEDLMGAYMRAQGLGMNSNRDIAFESSGYQRYESFYVRFEVNADTLQEAAGKEQEITTHLKDIFWCNFVTPLSIHNIDNPAEKMLLQKHYGRWYDGSNPKYPEIGGWIPQPVDESTIVRV